MKACNYILLSQIPIPEVPERPHSTISYKIRMLYIKQKSLGIKIKTSRAIEYYNKSFHSITREKPFDIEFG